MNSYIIDTFYLFFEGVLFFQAAFFGMAFYITKRNEVLYYSLLNLVSAIYFLINESSTFLITNRYLLFHSDFFQQINFILLLSLFLLYVLFLKEIFIESFEKHTYVKKIYKATCVAIAILFVTFEICALMGWNTKIVFYAVHLVNTPFCMTIMLLNFRDKSYKALIIYAMYFSFLCLLITLVFTIRYYGGSNETLLDKYPLAFIKVSMLVDIILFQLAILKNWNEREKLLALEKLSSQLAVEKLRNQISSELHDDIGSTLSGVSIYSHLTNKQMENGEYDLAKSSLNIIQESTNEIVDKLSDLVWSVNPKHETIDYFFNRIELFANQMCSAKNIIFIFSKHIQHMTISQEIMHHLYLIVKEAINNAVKYSEATTLLLNIDEYDGKLSIEVNDNGKGFDKQNVKLGNGLTGMNKRAKEIGAEFSLKSELGKGTTLSIQLKFIN